MPEFSSSLALLLPETHVCVWKIDEPEEFFTHVPSSWPPINSENPIKRLESMTARYCLYDLCKRIGMTDVLLQQDERQRPYLLDSDWKISLTHSFPYVAAACCRTNEVGVDIEKKGRKIEKIAPRFLNQMELTNRQGNHTALTVAWSIKESIYKGANIPGLSFRNAIALEIHTEKQMGKATLGNADKTANYYWEEFEEFVLTLALID